MSCCREHRQTIRNVFVYYQYKGKLPRIIDGKTGYSYRFQQDDIRMVHKDDEPIFKSIPEFRRIGI
jgi:hypothetical protein